MKTKRSVSFRAAVSIFAALCTSCAEDVVAPEADEAIPVRHVTLHLNCSMANPSEPTLTRTTTAPSAYFENVIHDLFALLFDADGICLACSDYTVIEGSLTEVSDYQLQMDYASTNTHNTLYVFCNLGETLCADLARRFDRLALTSFRGEAFSIEPFRQLDNNQSNSTYLPACAIYKGAVMDHMTLSLIMGRYLSRVAVKLAASSDGVFTNITVGLHQAPKKQQYIPVSSSAEYLVNEFFTDDDMADKLSISRLVADADSTRYFYVGENLNPSKPTTIRLTGRKNQVPFETYVPITGAGIVNRNSNYEVELILQ